MDNSTRDTYNAIRDMQTKLFPTICALGFLTNSLSLLVFLQPGMRRLSCSVYLAAKAVSDFLFLLTVFIIWLERVEVFIFHKTGICQTVVFLSYLTAFVSIWLAVTLTMENLLCITKPYFVQKTCNTQSASMVTFAILALGVLLYHFSLWNNGVRSSGKQNLTSSFVTDQVKDSNLSWLVVRNDFLSSGSSVNITIFQLAEQERKIHLALSNYSVATEYGDTCMELEEFNLYLLVITYLDFLLTLLIPVIILIVTNMTIVFFAVRTKQRQRRRQIALKTQYQLPGKSLASNRKNAASLETQAFRFLFAVSMTTLLFHLPSHVIRLINVFYFTSMNMVLQRIFEIIYYTHYAIGLFVYLIFGENFRKVFFSLLKRRVR